MGLIESTNLENDCKKVFVGYKRTLVALRHIPSHNADITTDPLLLAFYFSCGTQWAILKTWLVHRYRQDFILRRCGNQIFLRGSNKSAYKFKFNTFKNYFTHWSAVFRTELFLEIFPYFFLMFLLKILGGHVGGRIILKMGLRDRMGWNGLD